MIQKTDVIAASADIGARKCREPLIEPEISKRLAGIVDALFLAEEHMDVEAASLWAIVLQRTADSFMFAVLVAQEVGDTDEAVT